MGWWGGTRTMDEGGEWANVFTQGRSKHIATKKKRYVGSWELGVPFVCSWFKLFHKTNVAPVSLLTEPLHEKNDRNKTEPRQGIY